MSFDEFLKILSPIITIFIGIWLKVTKDEKASAYKKYWWVMVILGLLGLVFGIYKRLSPS